MKSPLRLAIEGIALIALVLLLGSCAREDAPEENPVVGVIRSTSHEYTLHSGPEGTLYTVRTAEGKRIVKEVSRASLAQSHPELSEELAGLWAGNLRTGRGPSQMESTPELMPVSPVLDEFRTKAVPAESERR